MPEIEELDLRNNPICEFDGDILLSKLYDAIPTL